MQIAGKPIRVKLKKDLTRYDSRLIVGEMGWTIPNEKIGPFGSLDNAVAVRFDNGACLDIFYNSLELIEEQKP